jgi:Amidohydrolase
MERQAQQEIIDVHCHCLAGLDQSELVAAGLARLRRAGVSQLAVMGLVNTRFNAEEIARLIPAGFANLGDPLCFEVDSLLQLSQRNGAMLFPMVDTRCMTGSVSSLLPDYIGRGFRGIKGLYLADAGNDLQIASIPELFGISSKQYHDREWEIFGYAEAHDLPVLYHMDAHRYGEVLRAILDDFPRLRINFPHFGIGRKALRNILDVYPNVYTDIAYLRPHILKDPESYRDFIRHYPDRVCFGTDALLYQPEIILQYIDLVHALQLPEDLETRVFSGNPRRFLGLPAVTN